VDILFALLTLAFGVLVFLILIGLANLVERASEEPKPELSRMTDGASSG
jgi:hypothetical protein